MHGVHGSYLGTEQSPGQPGDGGSSGRVWGINQDQASWWPLALVRATFLSLEALWVLHGLLSSRWTEAHSAISVLGAACEAQDLGVLPSQTYFFFHLFLLVGG